MHTWMICLIPALWTLTLALFKGPTFSPTQEMKTNLALLLSLSPEVTRRYPYCTWSSSKVPFNSSRPPDPEPFKTILEFPSQPKTSLMQCQHSDHTKHALSLGHKCLQTSTTLNNGSKMVQRKSDHDHTKKGREQTYQLVSEESERTSSQEDFN